MKRTRIIAMAFAISLTLTAISWAEEMKMVGTISKIQVSGNQATVLLKDSKSGKSTEVIIKDELTLDKLKDKRIVEGDEVRVKYDSAKGNESNLFRKTAGC